MALVRFAYRAPQRHAHAPILRAAVVTALLSAAAALLVWRAPEGCAAGVDQAGHRWTCLLPGLMIVIPPVVAIFLSVFTTLNQRRERPFPDGWLVIIVAVGMLNQVLLAGAYLIALGPAYLGPFLARGAFVPQPFLAGAVAAGVFWIVLHRQALGTGTHDGRG